MHTISSMLYLCNITNILCMMDMKLHDFFNVPAALM